MTSPVRVLMIDDNEDLRDLLQMLLQEVGYSVAVADDGVRGVEAILQDPPDIAVVDIGLPRLDGYGVARQVREALGDKVYLIAMTGYGQAEDRLRSKDAGFDAHLTKPVTVEMLKQALLAAQTVRANAQR